MKRILLLGAALLTGPGFLAAQSVNVGASWWLKSPRVNEYRLGVGGFGRGALRVVYSAQFLKQADTSKAHWYGAGADLILRTTPTAQPYIIAGGAVGAGRGIKGGGEEPGVGLWGGVGAELFTLGPIGLQAEALYQWRSKVQLHGFSLGLRIGTKFGRVDPNAPLPPIQLPKSNPSDEQAIRDATAARNSVARDSTVRDTTVRESGVTGGAVAGAEVVVTAVGVMGTPYRWGGSDSTGFDCSGLIRYAYAQHGITLPRRSTDQARTGTEVGRSLPDLAPGDILTFADAPGGQVVHVGLYLGNGRFIHSARGGVQISVLGPDDSVGKWWWQRWTGTRRLL